jgi:hypothetical protein
VDWQYETNAAGVGTVQASKVTTYYSDIQPMADENNLGHKTVQSGSEKFP